MLRNRSWHQSTPSTPHFKDKKKKKLACGPGRHLGHHIKMSDKNAELDQSSTQGAGDSNSISSFEKVSLHSAEPSDRDSPVNSEHDVTTQEAAPPSGASQPSADLEMTSAELIDEITPADEEDAHLIAGDYSKPAAPSSGNSPSGRGGMDPVVRELEEAAAVAAAATAEAAAAAKQKIMQGAAGAKAFMSSLWSAFDDPSSTASREHESEQALRQRLGLGDDEAILEVFRCKLIQTYSPSNNDFTPPKNIAFTGLLHVASGHVCFELDGAGGVGTPVSVPKADLKAVVREGDALRVALSGDRELVIGAFSLPKLEVESAFALLTSLMPPV